MADRSGVIAHTEENESTRAILENVLRDVTNILHAEVKLARAEVKDDVRTAGKAAGLYGAAALCGLLAAASVVACLIAGLALVMPLWLAAVLAAVVLACAGGAFYVRARARMSVVNPPLRDIKDRIRSNYQWVKQQTR
jgi:hypothetical protein